VRAKKRDLGALRTVLYFALAYGLAIGAARLNLFARGEDAIRGLFAGQPKVQLALARLYRTVTLELAVSYGNALFFASVLAPLGFLARTLARARVRAGLADPLERARRFVKTRTRWTRALILAPTALFCLALARIFWTAFAGVPSDDLWAAALPGLALPVGLVGFAYVALMRRGLAALVAPTLDEDEANEEARAEGFTFDAVAVTPETRAAVFGLAGLSLVMTIASFSLPVSTLMRDPRFFAAIVAYVGIALGGAVVFRRASRVSIGLDGVLVHGSSRTRFYGYRDVDGARVEGSDLVLYRRDSVVVRLQLHGKDAARREALLARLLGAIERARLERNDPTATLVSASTKAQLTRAADGGSDYRQAAVSRDQLWALVEGPGVDTEARRAAAEALAKTSDQDDRARLRVAAEHSAEPSVRVRLHELLEDSAAEVSEGARAAATISR
jgi:hypothetical protein